MSCPYWQNTEKPCYFFSESNWNYNRTYNKTYNIWENYYYYRSSAFLYPKTDLKSIEQTYKVTTLNPDSKLYFDSGSGFPRFKLGLTTNKRCIKPAKADYIVVSGKSDYQYSSGRYAVIEDDTCVRLINENSWGILFGQKLEILVNLTNGIVPWSNPKLVHFGEIYGYNKDNVYLAKYATGEYTLNYITDNDLDKLVSNICPEPTYDELESVLDMLNSEDAATVQLGVRMIQGYNVDKYKMTMRLILCTRSNWYLFTKNTVGTKQLIESLGINRYNIADDFYSGSRYACKNGESYTVEDIALAKRLGTKMLNEYFQNLYKSYFLDYNYQWLPDERKVRLT